MIMGLWSVGNNSGTHPPLLSRHLVLQNLRNINFPLILSRFPWRPTKSQWSPHFSKQSVPGLFYLEPHRKVSATTLELRATNFKNFTQNDQTVFKAWLFAEIWVSKSPGFVPGSPPGGFIFLDMTPKTNMFLENCKNIKLRHCLLKWRPFLCLFWGPMPFFGPH